MTIEIKFLGAPPVGLVEKSWRVVETIAIFLSNGYITYQMYEGVSYYSGSVDYSRITLQ